jgi:hypothetical protein
MSCGLQIDVRIAPANSPGALLPRVAFGCGSHAPLLTSEVDARGFGGTSIDASSWLAANTAITVATAPTPNTILQHLMSWRRNQLSLRTNCCY